MATICAFSLARLLPPDSLQLQVYTFGAPRTGNHAFAALYNQHVPDTWQAGGEEAARPVCHALVGAGRWQRCIEPYTMQTNGHVALAVQAYY